MGRSNKSAWLEGPGDLQEADVEDVPVKGQSVRVRGLAATYSNQAASEALEVKQVGRDQISTINQARMEVLQFHHGVIDPTFSLDEVEQIARKYGPAFKKVVGEIDRLSGIDKEAVAEANARFQGGGANANGADVGDGAPPGSDGPDIHLRTGGEPGQDGPGDADRQTGDVSA